MYFDDFKVGDSFELGSVKIERDKMMAFGRVLQVCHNLSEAGHKVLYISGEESKVQIKMRADRLGTFYGS